MNFLALLRTRATAWRQLSPTLGARLVDELECVLSVLLAIGVAQLVGAKNVSWAAFSGYMVMRGHLLDSFLRGTLRVLGTAFGAGLALFIVPAVQASWATSSLAAAIIGGVSLYAALTGRHSYGWLFLGLTFEMILLDKLANPNHAITAFATTRFMEVASGTSACIIVSIVSALTLRRRWPGMRAPALQRIGWHPRAAQHAIQAALALGLLPLLGAQLGMRDLSQGAVSIMAVMVVPVSDLGKRGFTSVSVKLVHRIIGCAAGGALAAVPLFMASGSTSILVSGTAAGVFIGRYIENSGRSFAYVGTQFTLAVLVTLVPDNYTDAAIAPALDRLYGILVGMILLEPVLVAWRSIVAMTRPRANRAVAADE